MMAKRHRSSNDAYRMRTRLIHGNRESQRWDFNHHVIPPMSASAAYRLGSVHRGVQGFVEFASEEADLSGHVPIYIYDRLDEPTRGMLEENLAYAESGETAVCFASGMAAISAALGVTTQAGDEIVAHHTVYGCTYSLLTTWLPRFGVHVKFADLLQAESFAQAVTDRTRVVYFETPVNPTLDLIDIAQVRYVGSEIVVGCDTRTKGSRKTRYLLLVLDYPVCVQVKHVDRPGIGARVVVAGRSDRQGVPAVLLDDAHRSDAVAEVLVGDETPHEPTPAVLGDLNR